MEELLKFLVLTAPFIIIGVGAVAARHFRDENHTNTDGGII